MVSKIEHLAVEISALEEHKQQVLWKHVAELDFSRGLHALSEQYQERLRQQGALSRSGEEILSELRTVREEVAVYDYPG